MDALRAIQVFARVVQQGSLSSAARQLDSSPASVSRQISALEATLGARLLNRTSRKLTLTEAGEAYYHHVEKILHHMDEAQQSVSQLQATPRGTLRVHSRILVGQVHVVEAVADFLLRYPELTVDLMLSNQAVDLVEQNIDVDVRIGKLSDSALIARPLAVSERLVCAAPSYLARHPAPRNPGELAGHNCLTYRLHTGGSVTWRFADAQGRTTDIPVAGSFRTDHSPSLRRMALAGVGLVLMPEWSVREDLASGALVRLFADQQVSFTEFDSGIYAVYQRSRFMSAKVRLFVEHLVEVFEKGVGPRA